MEKQKSFFETFNPLLNQLNALMADQSSIMIKEIFLDEDELAKSRLEKYKVAQAILDCYLEMEAELMKFPDSETMKSQMLASVQDGLWRYNHLVTQMQLLDGNLK